MPDDRKRYQVFVSSTFRDLQLARQEVILRLLEADAFPAGMELFPATSDDAWTLIQGVIDESDYYLVVVAGRYGSVDEEAQLSFTEMEYDYASSQGKPVMAFLHGSAGDIPAKDSETTEAGRAKLAAFRAKIEKERHVKYWTSPDQLGGQVAATFNKFTRFYPAVGWMRADNAAQPDSLARIAEMQVRIDDLERQLANAAETPPPGTEDLAQGADTARLFTEWKLTYRSQYSEITASAWHWGSTTWDSIFGVICPKLLLDAEESTIHEALNAWAALEFWDQAQSSLKEFYTAKGIDESDVTGVETVIDQDSFGTVIVQLLALGLIRTSEKRRSVSDKGTYWTLTPFGHTKAVQIRAERRVSAPVGSTTPSDASTTD